MVRNLSPLKGLPKMLYMLFYWILNICLKTLIWTTSIEIVNRLSFILPSRLLVEILRDYGAVIGEDVKITPPIHFHNLANRTRKPFQNLTIGMRCYLGPRLFLDLKEKITLEDQVTLAMDVMLITHTDVSQSPLRE